MDAEGDALFAGHPELRAVHIASIRYPPLARQTRIAGTVVLHVTVGNDGSVKQVDVVKGHPLLSQSSKDSVGRWKFAPPGADRTFDLTCDFVNSDYSLRSTFQVAGPVHLIVTTFAPTIQTNYSAAS